MTKITQQPAAQNACLKMIHRFDVFRFRHLRYPDRKIRASIAGEGQGIPKAPIHFHENRRASRNLPELNHRSAVPMQGSQNGQRMFSGLRVWFDTHAQSAARSSGMYIPDAAMRELRS